MVYHPGAVKHLPQCFQGASILTPKRHTSDISHHLDCPFLKITGQAWQKHQENTRLRGNTSTKVESLWLEARKFAHVQTEQTKLAFTAFLQTRCCVKTLSQCSMDQGFPFENKNRYKIEFSKLTPFPWNTAIPADIPSMPRSSRYMSPRPVCAQKRAVCPQSTTIQGDLKHHVEPDSQLTCYALFAAGTSDKTTPMKNNIVGAKSFWDTSLQKKTTPLLDEGDHSGASDILPWKKGH